MKIGQYMAMAVAMTAISQNAHAEACNLTPKHVASSFMDEFYNKKNVKTAFETWVDPGYIQHNPTAATGRDATLAVLLPFFAANPHMSYSIKRIIADGDLVAIHTHARLTETDRGMAIVDILRIKDCKVVEHWDVMQPVPENPANENGMF